MSFSIFSAVALNSFSSSSIVAGNNCYVLVTSNDKDVCFYVAVGLCVFDRFDESLVAIVVDGADDSEVIFLGVGGVVEPFLQVAVLKICDADDVC